MIKMIEAVSSAGRKPKWERYGQELSQMGRALAKYLEKRGVQAKVEWPLVGAGLVVLVIGLSIASGYLNSPTLAGNREEVIRRAAMQGDYETAQEMYEEGVARDNEGKQVLGARLELENLVYPKRRIRREIEREEEKLRRYPGHRDILLNLAWLYGQLGQEEKAEWYLTRAEKLDPNGEEVEKMQENLENLN